ncbi:MAG: CHAD domain-containing protein, partial [Armatimonadia bacterium]
MPKPWCVDQLTPEMPLPQAAAAILAVKLPETLSYEAEARAGDVDGVHDMRVGSKRLREALRVFRPVLPDRHRDALLPFAEQLNDALGLVRDRDVLIQQFERIMRRDPRAAPLAKLVAHLKRERARRHREFLTALDELHRRGMVKTYEAAMRALTRAPAGSMTLLEFATSAINERLNPVLDNMEIVHFPVDGAAFHRQRIRVKKLKYALELFIGILLAETEIVYDHLGELQELMGEVHDVEVEGELLQAWEKAEGTSPGLSVAIDWLTQRGRELRYAAKQHAEVLEAEGFERRLR